MVSGTVAVGVLLALMADALVARPPPSFAPLGTESAFLNRFSLGNSAYRAALSVPDPVYLLILSRPYVCHPGLASPLVWFAARAYFAIYYILFCWSIIAAAWAFMLATLLLTSVEDFWSTAFSALRLFSHQSFLRMAIKEDGTLRIFPIGISTHEKGDRKIRLIEPPVDIAPVKVVTLKAGATDGKFASNSVRATRTNRALRDRLNKIVHKDRGGVPPTPVVALDEMLDDPVATQSPAARSLSVSSSGLRQRRALSAASGTATRVRSLSRGANAGAVVRALNTANGASRPSTPSGLPNAFAPK